MADGTSDAAGGPSLEGAAAEWLAERASDADVSEKVLLQRIVGAYRAATEDADNEFVTDDELREQVGDVEREFDEKIQDVRERVIQVKREADGKATADHDHAEVSQQAADAVAAAESAQAEAGVLAEEVDRLADRVDAGFDNFEEVLSYLRDETDDLDGKATTLATAVLSMRESVRSLAAAEARRERAEQLQREANVSGVQNADCDACGQSVTVAQLSAPECPFCAESFEGVEAKTGWFGSHTLVTGRKPALTAKRSWLDDDGESDSWLGGDTETLEAMATGADDAGETDDEATDAWVEEADVDDAVDVTAAEPVDSEATDGGREDPDD
ncbi:hypothetical protein [Halobacterium wangiae]|uniref:hypothetical protein n=1 Tax=Halobacterium wangiae TaxID=2902623 RepID=UPI001E35F03A|nr:hypothetical protein [Halobacterium wangiae]